MKKIIVCAAALLALGGCGKIGFEGAVSQALGNWAEVQLPPGCKAKQIAGEEGNGTIVLCEDGRLFR